MLIRFSACFLFFFFKQKTAYEMRISDWSSDVCSSDLDLLPAVAEAGYFVGCASRLMANDLILVCADAARNPAWGLFLVSRVGPEGVILENVAGLTPDTINGLTFLPSPPGPLPVGKLLREDRAARAARRRGAGAWGTGRWRAGPVSATARSDRTRA